MDIIRELDFFLRRLRSHLAQIDRTLKMSPIRKEQPAILYFYISADGAFDRCMAFKCGLTEKFGAGNYIILTVWSCLNKICLAGIEAKNPRCNRVKIIGIQILTRNRQTFVLSDGC